MYCYNCGKQIDDKAVVCIGCGISLKSKYKVKNKTNDRIKILTSLFVPIILATLALLSVYPIGYFTIAKTVRVWKDINNLSLGWTYISALSPAYLTIPGTISFLGLSISLFIYFLYKNKEETNTIKKARKISILGNIVAFISFAIILIIAV